MKELKRAPEALQIGRGRKGTSPLLLPLVGRGDGESHSPTELELVKQERRAGERGRGGRGTGGWGAEGMEARRWPSQYGFASAAPAGPVSTPGQGSPDRLLARLALGGGKGKAERGQNVKLIIYSVNPTVTC